MIKIPFPESSPVLKEREKSNKNNYNHPPRTDARTRQIVEKAVELQSIVGTAVAAGLLKTKHVPFDVAERVLRHPRLRRNFSKG